MLGSEGKAGIIDAFLVQIMGHNQSMEKRLHCGNEADETGVVIRCDVFLNAKSLSDHHTSVNGLETVTIESWHLCF